MGSVVKSFC
jgi:hypothetical protein